VFTSKKRAQANTLGLLYFFIAGSRKRQKGEIMKETDVKEIDYRVEFKKVADHWGYHMPMMLAEECGELIQAVSKDQRKFTVETQEAVLTEMADVIISIGALMAQMELEPTDLFDHIDAKLMKQY
jgi:phosphoribosyl-ATP pyrophosphohydrolase